MSISFPWLIASPEDLASNPLRIAGLNRRRSPVRAAQLTIKVAKMTGPHGLDAASSLLVMVSLIMDKVSQLVSKSRSRIILHLCT